MAAERVAGKSHPRRESWLKVTGRAQYTGDLKPPGLAYGAVLRSPHANARVREMDLSRALAVPGVLAILGPEDVPQTPFNCAGNPPSPLLINDERILTKHPRHAGDRLVAVAGESREACEAALRAIRVEYEILPPVFTIKQALAPDAPLIQPDFSETNIIKTITAQQGDVEAGLAQSDLVFEDEFQTPTVQHGALEPIDCLAHYTPAGELNLWSTSQAPFQERRLLAGLMGLPENRIRIIKPIMGGGFGARQQLHNQHLAALLSKAVNRPVRITNTREEELYASTVRHEAVIKLRAGVSRSGLLQAFEAEVFFNAGPYASHSPIVAAAASRKFQYRTPNYRYQGHCVLTNAPVAGAMRGYGNPQLTFARERLMDRLADELGLDPVAFRLMNHVRVGQSFPAAPVILQSCAIEECVAGAQEIKARIEARPPKKKDAALETAWGVAFGCHTSGPSSKEGMSACLILANTDGTVQLMTGSADIGQGSETALSQVAAEILGLNLEDVAIIAADTGRTPYDTGTFASSQMYVAGNAVAGAAHNLAAEVKLALAQRYGLETGNISWQNDQFSFSEADRDRVIGFKEAVGLAGIQPPGKGGAVLMGRASFKATESPPPFAVCWAKVGLDRAANSIKVLELIEAVDVGRPINPRIVTGQVEGGLAMGLGYAMMEQLEIDPRAAKPISSDLLHYRLPLISDMPPTHAFIAPSYEPTGPLGAKSVGELTTVPVAPAIANAVTRLLGEPVNRLPISRLALPAVPRLAEARVSDPRQGGGHD